MIFVNYRQNRRSGAGSELRAHAQAVEAVTERLRQHFGQAAVFLDTGLRPATRYPDELRDRLLGSELVVAVIHREWLADLRDREGGLDWVHHELATALARGVPVLPVLLAGARLPEAHELPADLADLAKCQAYALRFGQWEHGVRALIETAELFVSPEPLPAPGAEPEPRLRLRWGIPVAGLLGAVLPVGLVQALAVPVERMAWLAALAIVLVALLAVVLGTAVVAYAVRGPVDRIDRAWAQRPGDEKTTVVVGATIAGLALIVLVASKIPVELQLLGLGIVVVVVLVLSTQWINHREAALTWPRPWLPASPAAIRAELVRVRQHLARPGPLSRADRDKAAFAVARLAECVDRLRAAHGLRRGAWLRASTPLVTLPHAALLGSALGTTASAVVLHFQAGGAPWPALGWASGGVVAAVGCYLGAVLVTHRLVWWRRDVVLRTVEEELAALRVS